MTEAYVRLALKVVKDWPKIDEVWERVSEQHDAHLNRKAYRSNETFLHDAFVLASGRGFYEALVMALYHAELLKAAPAEAAAALASAGKPVGSALQAMVDAGRTVLDPLVLAEAIKKCCDYICRIDIDDAHVGTGVYLREGLVATAAHVIDRLLAKDAADVLLRTADGGLVAGPATAGRLKLIFDYAVRPNPGGVPQISTGFSVRPREDWLLWGSSPVHPGANADQGDVRDITRIGFPHGPWDLALIQLREPVMHIHRYPELARTVPHGTFPISVLHHIGGPQPAGQPVGFSTGYVDDQLGTPDVVRYLHDATTDRGASGAPLFDSQWRVVGIHERGPGSSQGAASAAGAAPAPLRNRAVPVQCWRHELDRRRTRVIPYLRELPDIDSFAGGMEPVFGRTETQRRLWTALQPHAETAAPERLLVVRGEPGSGNRFTRRLAEAYVRRARQPIISLDLANQLSASAGDFLRWLLGALSQEAPEATPTALTTGARDARDLLPGLVRGLAAATEQHPVWLVLEGFSGAPLDVPGEVSEMIAGVVKELRYLPRLRMVLIGWLATLPAGFHTSIEDLTLPTEDEAIDLLRLAGYDAESKHPEAVRRIYREVVGSELSGYAAVRRTAEIIDEWDDGGGAR